MVADPPTAVSLGMHTLRWEYSKDSSGSDGDDCGWVDYLQWDGDTEPPPAAEWQTLRYVYACPIRLSLRAGSEPAEWDPGRRPSSSNNQSSIILHHFPRLYGPSVDEPICMIEEAGTYSGTYYYHFDALGSVVALSNAAGNTVQAYDYSVWGQVGAEVVDHPNPYLFTGRRFDKETGLYYYRARYYNPEIGRFLQTDPVGYDAGMNLYRYCTNNPLNMTDPHGRNPITQRIFGPGTITFDSSCVGAPIALMPEHSSAWIAEPNAEEKYEADAIGFYDPNGNQKVFKLPDGCRATVRCERSDGKTGEATVEYWCPYGILIAHWLSGTPWWTTPQAEGWPALPPGDQIKVIQKEDE